MFQRLVRVKSYVNFKEFLYFDTKFDIDRRANAFKSCLMKEILILKIVAYTS